MELIHCLVCGEGFRALYSHVPRKHGLTIAEYKSQYPGAAIQLDAVRAKRVLTCRLHCGRKKGVKLTPEHVAHLSLAVRGTKNPFYGRKHTDATRAKMRAHHADFRGEKNPFRRWWNRLDVDSKAVISARNSAGLRAFYKTDRGRALAQKASVRETERVRESEGAGPSGYKRGVFVSEKFSPIYYRSSYEYKFLCICEESAHVKTCETAFAISYSDEKGILRRYTPDFLLNDAALIEIKPYNMLSVGNNPPKFEAARRFAENHGYTYTILTENDLNLPERGAALVHTTLYYPQLLPEINR